MILIGGAAGKTGQAVIRALANEGLSVRAFVHRDSYADVVREAGADDVVVGSMLDAAAYRRAADGVRAMYHVPPNMQPAEVEMGKAAIEAAQAAGVERFVFHSVLRPHIEAMPHHWKKAQVEAMLFASGVDFSILQPAVYMQNALAQQQEITERQVYEVPYPVETALGYVDLLDVAEAALIVLTGTGYNQGTYELCGEGNLTQVEIAARLSKVLKYGVKASELPLVRWREMVVEQGHLSNYARDTLAAMFEYYAMHGMTGNSHVLRWLLGRKQTSFRSFIEREFVT